MFQRASGATDSLTPRVSLSLEETLAQSPNGILNSRGRADHVASASERANEATADTCQTHTETTLANTRARTTRAQDASRAKGCSARRATPGTFNSDARTVAPHLRLALAMRYCANTCQATPRDSQLVRSSRSRQTTKTTDRRDASLKRERTSNVRATEAAPSFYSNPAHDAARARCVAHHSLHAQSRHVTRHRARLWGGLRGGAHELGLLHRIDGSFFASSASDHVLPLSLRLPLFSHSLKREAKRNVGYYSLAKNYFILLRNPNPARSAPGLGARHQHVPVGIHSFTEDPSSGELSSREKCDVPAFLHRIITIL